MRPADILRTKVGRVKPLDGGFEVRIDLKRIDRRVRYSVGFNRPSTSRKREDGERRQAFPHIKIRGDYTIIGDAGLVIPALRNKRGRLKWGNALKDRLSEQQNHRCCYCGKRLEANGRREDYPTFDHIVAFSRGGKDAPSNFVIACRGCNEEKGSDEWIE